MSTTAPVDHADALAERLGHRFADPELATHALRHRSWCAEHGGDSNERLEYLGDSVLGLVVSDHVFRAYPERSESELSKIRSAVVSGQALAAVAREIGLGELLLLGKGEDLTGGRDRTSILCDVMEALFAAVYLDAGLDAARAVIHRLLGPRIVEAATGPGVGEYKSQLQELAVRRFEAPPRYTVVEDDGPPHDKRYFATVRVAGELLGEGEGRSKKQAETAAAHQAWLRLAADEEPPGGGEPSA
ncbi:MAG: ribonuclease III [Acidimicrobiales bacterium]|nr:ribonuclease III [Acidimicrobiales bacterium]